MREAYWQARLAATELDLARRKVEEAAALAVDVERRLKAGDLARADLNQARIVEQLARSVLAETRARAYRGAQAFSLLTGLKTLPAVNEPGARRFSCESAEHGKQNARWPFAPEMRLNSAFDQ